MTKLAQRFIETAIRESDETGRFDPSRMMRRLNLNEFQLNEVAQELVNSGDLLVTYARDGLHRWQLLGAPRSSSQEHPPLPAREPGARVTAGKPAASPVKADRNRRTPAGASLPAPRKPSLLGKAPKRR